MIALFIWCYLCGLTLPSDGARPNARSILRIEWKRPMATTSETTDDVTAQPNARGGIKLSGFGNARYTSIQYRKLREGGSAAALEAAKQVGALYCQQKTLRMFVVSTTVTIEGDSWAEGSATFRCLDPNDQRFAQPSETPQPLAADDSKP